ncbi:Tyrosine-protein kinase-like otk [Labeo rohita]|uniref:Tyrosine-protein kinase-like otk n=1 Tax=Labeo rohita TaxID=84645 RepID=A0ABQ8LB81_LABRO|nr:Tyrosine-protein kinase-like otk [Labeo rohita]
MTGSLTITNISTEHTGLYKLQISSSSRGILYKKFKVSTELTDKVENKVVNERDSVTLNPDTKNTEIQEDDLVLWMFGYNNNVIAQIRGGTEQTYDGDRKRFKDRLKLDKTTGSLTITNISTEHTGFYKLQIISSSGGILYNNFSVLIQPVTNKVEEKSVNERDSVTLNPHTEIQRDDQIQWMFGDENDLIAQISGGTGETRDGDKKRFKDRLKLNNTTGSLTITNISSEHTGLYKLKIISSSRGILYKEFKVSVQLEEKLVDEGKSVTLNPDTEIKGDDQILWMFGDEDDLIAQIRGETVKIYDGAKKRFKDRLKLDKTTGSLTITNISTEHTGLTGLYKLQIISSRGILYKKFWVFIKCK